MVIKIGSTFGNWIVISEKFKRDNVFWNTCECICGTIRDVRTWQLNNNKTKGCGCSNEKGRFKYEGIGELSKAYFTSFKNTRKNKNIPFSEDITMEFLWEMFLKQNKKCALSKLDIVLNPKWSSQNKGQCKNKNLFQTASLDRIDNSLGYTKENVQWVHKDVNYMKGGLTTCDFLFICKKISESNEICSNDNNFIGKRLYFGSSGS